LIRCCRSRWPRGVAAEDYRALRGDENSTSDGKVGKDRTMLDEKRRITIGYVNNNNQSWEIDEAGVDVVTSHLHKRRGQK